MPTELEYAVTMLQRHVESVPRMATQQASLGFGGLSPSTAGRHACSEVSWLLMHPGMASQYPAADTRSANRPTQVAFTSLIRLAVVSISFDDTNKQPPSSDLLISLFGFLLILGFTATSER
jgi:hypothetical protein